MSRTSATPQTQSQAPGEAGQTAQQHADTLCEQGLALHRQGKLLDAKTMYEQVLAKVPAHFDGLHLLGVIAAQTHSPALAVELLGKAIAIKPSHAMAHSSLGNALKELQRFDEAVACYDRAIEIKPDFAEAYCNRGVALKALQQIDKALDSYDRAIELKPDYAQAYYNRGNALMERNQVEQAIADFDAAIAIDPDYAKAYYNRGNALGKRNQVEQAIADFDAAIAINPDYADAYWNKSIASLLAGQYLQGWELYEWRWRPDKTGVTERPFAQSPWLGVEALADKTILLHAEQGLGDTIQFSRYARLVKALGARVLLKVPASLVGLFDSLDGVDELIGEGKPLPDFDFHCPLMSLPLAFKTQLATIPSSEPYLSVSADKLQVWSERLGQKARPRVGLVWRGNPAYENDHNRSLSLDELLPHLPEGFDYVSLQKEVTDVERELLLTRSIAHYGEWLFGFDDTAALCCAVDAVVSVDTSVAHLAGALGTRTWVLLPFAPDWRWLLNRDDSPWYGSVRLYRQGPDRKWASVLERIAQDLRKLAT